MTMRSSPARFAVVATVLMLGGCSILHWPAEQGGGAAEITFPQRDRLALVAAIPEAEAVLLRLDRAEGQLLTLARNGGLQARPADLHRSRMAAIRIRREIAGGLVETAADNLLQLEQQLTDLSRQMTDRETVNVKSGMGV